MRKNTQETARVAHRMEQELDACKHDLLIECGYFIPRTEGLAQILNLRKQGVQVSVLTGALETADQPLVYSAYRRYRREMLEVGVDIFEYKVHARISPSAKKWFAPRKTPSSLHSKVMVFDHERVWIGSFNIDGRSVWYNTEIAALINSPVLAAQLARLIAEGCTEERSWQVKLVPNEKNPSGAPKLRWVGERDDSPVSLSKEPARNWWIRFRTRVYSLIPGIEHLL